MERLYDKLCAYSASDYYGFHMPGHKRQAVRETGLPYHIDITEIEGFDDLHHAHGILKSSQELAAKVYGAEETRFLVNGSTAGVLSAILGNTERGDQILVARNCHKSVYHGIYLNGLKPVYLYPEFCETLYLNTDISVSAVKAALMEHSGIRAVILVSPAYDGVISDVSAIAKAVHGHGIPLIVDEAHGAHLGFHPYFDENALAKGADVVIHSIHKTLPALTQTALLHVQGELANRKRMFRYLDMLQSSSPSYVLMAGIDACIHLLDERPEEMFEPYVRRLRALRGNIKNLRNITLLESERFDPSKLVISTREQQLSGRELYQILLKDYHLQMEMPAGIYVLGMTSVNDSEEGFVRLENALREIDAMLPGERAPRRSAGKSQGRLPVNEQAMDIAQTLDAVDRGCETERVCYKEALGRVSAEYAYLYPPGSPVIVPGERVSIETKEFLEQYEEMGYSIEGISQAGTLTVIKDKGLANG